MGAPFSPTMANIYMSIFLKNFLQTQPSKPYLLKRYIDDILIIWTGTVVQLQQFLQDLNKFNPNLKFTHQQSASTIDFLDVTIYKDTSFPFTNILDVKTFQKKLNLYQYLHFSSEHPRSVFKALIKGECIRYIKTNSTEESYIATVFSFRKRLLRRDYPAIFVEKATDTVKYSDRQKYLNKISKPPGPPPPLYKLVSPSGFNSLKQLVLQNYSKLKSMFPRFIPLRHPTLHNKLVRAQIKLTDSQFVDLTLSLNLEEEVPPSESLVKLPNLRPLKYSINACKQPRCLTCKVHLNTTPTFKSNYPLNQTQYAIRHTFSCRSSNVVYLITCTKCKKQYVGCTTTELRVRISHHRSSINQKRATYIHKHFNLPDHNITHLRVQPIDTTFPDKNIQHLHNLERFWINTLRTLTPYGLNSV